MAGKLVPGISVTPQVGPKKLPGGFVWGVEFVLPAPAGRSGHIFQEISMTEGSQTTTLAVHYMEAWPVNRGDAVITSPSFSMTLATLLGSRNTTADYNTACNDFFIRHYTVGSAGFTVYRAAAAFYEEPLPRGFVQNNPATGATALPSRVIDAANPVPRFWDGTGLSRILWFEFNFSRNDGTANATLKTLTVPMGRVQIGTNPAPSMWTTHP